MISTVLLIFCNFQIYFHLSYQQCPANYQSDTLNICYYFTYVSVNQTDAIAQCALTNPPSVLPIFYNEAEFNAFGTLMQSLGQSANYWWIGLTRRMGSCNLPDFTWNGTLQAYGTNHQGSWSSSDPDTVCGHKKWCARSNNAYWYNVLCSDINFVVCQCRNCFISTAAATTTSSTTTTTLTSKTTTSTPTAPISTSTSTSTKTTPVTTHSSTPVATSSTLTSFISTITSLSSVPLSSSTSTSPSSIITTTSTKRKSILEHDPLTKTERTVATVAQSLGCSVLIAFICLTLLVFFILRIISLERMLHMCQEISLLVAHIAINLSMKSSISAETGTVFGIILQYCFLANFTFSTLEALQTYCILKHVINSGGYFNRKINLLLGCGLPVPVVVVTYAMYPNDYISEYSFWLNFGSHIAFFTIIPLLLCFCLIAIMTEAATMGETKCWPLTSNEQYLSAMISQKGAMLITAFNVLSWSFGAFALYWQKIALYGFVFAFNCSLGVTIFIFHTLSNEKVANYLKHKFCRTEIKNMNQTNEHMKNTTNGKKNKLAKMQFRFKFGTS